jgi:hypothetical protein
VPHVARSPPRNTATGLIQLSAGALRGGDVDEAAAALDPPAAVHAGVVVAVPADHREEGLVVVAPTQDGPHHLAGRGVTVEVDHRRADDVQAVAGGARGGDLHRLLDRRGTSGPGQRADHDLAVVGEQRGEPGVVATVEQATVVVAHPLDLEQVFHSPQARFGAHVVSHMQLPIARR